MRRKILYGLGLVGALLTAEALNRFGAFVGGMGGSDAPIYNGILAVAVFDAGVLGAALLNKEIKKQVKWTALALTVPAFLLLFAAPALPVVIQAFIGLAMTVAGLVALPKPAAQGEALATRAKEAGQ